MSETPCIKIVSEQIPCEHHCRARGNMNLMLSLLVLLLLLASSAQLTNAKRCHREPHSDVTAAIKSPGDNGFRIVVGGDPERYVPGTVYTGNQTRNYTKSLI